MRLEKYLKNEPLWHHASLFVFQSNYLKDFVSNHAATFSLKQIYLTFPLWLVDKAI